jgi:hypothetical protein
MEAEVEKRLLVRFAPPTALRERRVMPREVSIVLVGDNNDNDYGEKVWDTRRTRKGTTVFVFRPRTN